MVLHCEHRHAHRECRYLSTRCPIARHRTVNARPRPLLVYEGNESHVIKNMAFVVFRTATVRCRAARHGTFVPCDQLFSAISFSVRCRAIGQRVQRGG